MTGTSVCESLFIFLHIGFTEWLVFHTYAIIQEFTSIRYIYFVLVRDICFPGFLLKACSLPGSSFEEEGIVFILKLFIIKK